MGLSYEGVQRVYGVAGTPSYLPSVRAGGALPLNADIDVQRWRRMGASWQAVAANLNVSVDTVRKAYDPSYVPVHAAAQPLAPARATGSRAAGQVASNTYQFDLLAALGAGELSRADLGMRVEVRPQDFTRLVGILIEKRLVAEPRKTVFTLTAAGRAELERHAAFDDGAVRKGAAVTQARRRERMLDVLRMLVKGPLTQPVVMDRGALGVTAARTLLADLRAAGKADFTVPTRGGPFLWSVTAKGRAALEAAAHG